jgi:hypothetical protein
VFIVKGGNYICSFYYVFVIYLNLFSLTLPFLWQGFGAASIEDIPKIMMSSLARDFRDARKGYGTAFICIYLIRVLATLTAGVSGGRRFVFLG